MNEILRRDAEQIIQASLRAVQPDAAVRRALLAEGAAELVARLKAMGLDRDEALELIGTLWEEAEG